MPVSISVIIPVYNGERDLEACLERIAASNEAPLECLVVDDGSTDGSADTARRAGATLLRTGRRSGPAAARNLAARQARGDVLLFLDADVMAHPDTIPMVRQAFSERPDLDAVMGAYDDKPLAGNFMSQYRNLMHCFVHRSGRRRASTFWTGCGAVRRDVFLAHGGFDEGYHRAAIEDIELGVRLARDGRIIELRPEIQVTHRKRWTFWGVLRTDFRDRGVPWTEIILREGRMPNDLNVDVRSRLSVVLAFLITAFALAGTLWHGGSFLTPAMSILFFLLGHYWIEAPQQRVRAGLFFLLCGNFVLAWWNGMIVLIPLLIAAYVLLIIRHRYFNKSLRRARISGLVYGVCIAFAIFSATLLLPKHPAIYCFYLLALALVGLNLRFYVFLGSTWGRMYALAAIPLHFLHHLSNGLSFGVGLLRHLLKSPDAPRPGSSFKAAG